MSVELTTRVVERRYAPIIVVKPRFRQKYCNQAELHHEIYERILTLSSEYDVYFEVDYSETVANKAKKLFLTVHYDLESVSIEDASGKRIRVSNSTVIPTIAEETASWVVRQVYGH